MNNKGLAGLCAGAVMVLASMPAFALDNDTVDAAIGGGLGGAAGAAIGNEIGGRNGAIVGGALGGAGGAAVTTDRDDHRRDHRRYHDDDYYNHYRYDDRRGHFCPPGQAKKGRC